MPSVVQLVVISVFSALVIVAALRDAATLTIPNWISAALVLAFAPAAFAAGVSWTAAGLALAAGVGMLVAGVVMFALRWIGGGDAKLLAACALWLGAPGLLPFLSWTALAGGVLALALLSARRVLAASSLPLPGPAWAARLLEPKGGIPYGVAIAAGALAALPNSPLLQALRG